MTRKKVAPEGKKKRPYRTPVLKTHGDLRALTTAKGGDRGDGGSAPKTRTTTSP
jgi:hypothetical protein